MAPQPGSIFAVLSRLVRWGLGGTAGPGTQRVSWMHADDYVRAVTLLLEDGSLEGVVNLAAPHAPTNRELMRALRQAWGVPMGLPAPGPLLELGALLMGTESELVLKSRWVLPTRLQKAGFAFRFPDWPAAAHNLADALRKRQ